MACDLSAATDTPALLVALTAARVQSAEGGNPQSSEVGAVRWLAAGDRRVTANPEAAPAEFLLFEFKGPR